MASLTMSHALEIFQEAPEMIAPAWIETIFTSVSPTEQAQPSSWLQEFENFLPPEAGPAVAECDFLLIGFDPIDASHPLQDWNFFLAAGKFCFDQGRTL